MNRGDNSKLHLPGGTIDRTNQLAFLSLGDGGYNTFVGFNAGNKFPSSNNTFIGTSSGGSSERVSTSVFLGSGSGREASRSGDTIAIGYLAGAATKDSYNNVLIGTQAGQGLRRADFNTAVGHKSMALMASGRRSVAIGAFSALQATSTANSVYVGYESGSRVRGSENVFVGAGAGQYAETGNTVALGYKAAEVIQGSENNVVVGATAGTTMLNSDNNVIVGYGTARTLQSSSYNTLIGSGSAGNTLARYSTMVGSNSMNRRNGGRVEFSNCVIVGENITFDLPVDTRTLRYTDARRIVSNGQPFYDSAHPFADPFVPLVASPGGGEGYVLYHLTEAPSGVQPLSTTERDLTFFGSFEVSPGTYNVSWYAIATEDVVVTSSASRYDVNVNITSNATHHTLALVANVESTPQVSETVYVANTSPSVTWMDLRIRQPPEPEGIVAEYSFASQGSILASGNLALTRYAASHPSDSYLRIFASSPGPRKAVYSTLTHAARLQSGVEVVNTFLGSAHAIRGSGTAANVNTLSALLLVNTATHTGFTAADYVIGLGLAVAQIDCTFQVPTTGSFGAEWLSDARTTDLAVGDGFVARCIVDGSFIEYDVHASGVTLFQVTRSSIFSFGRSVVDTSESLPIDISTLRIYGEVWCRLYITHDLRENTIESSLRFSGYKTDDYINGKPPQLTKEYTIRTSYEQSDVDPLLQGTISVFGSSTTGNIIARDLDFQSSFPRRVPLFERCIFIGSNFTVQNDEKDTLVMSLGPRNVIHATPNVFTISSESTRLEGHLTVGSSEESNYLAFRGLYNDGFAEDIPTAYIGERVYIPSTEKSELLLAKGEDPMGTRGPDRIRLLSGEIRVETFADVSPEGDSYVYNRANFESIAAANTTSVLVANATGVHFPSLGIGATELQTLKGIRGNVQQQLDNSFVTVTAGKILVSNTAGRVSNSNVNALQLTYLDGVTSSIQQQLNGKQPAGSYAEAIHTHAATDITSGIFDAARIPSLDAGKITSGTFDAARIPSLDAGKITSGTFDAARIPSLDAGKITTGTLSRPVSTTGDGEFGRVFTSDGATTTITTAGVSSTSGQGRITRLASSSHRYKHSIQDLAPELGDTVWSLRPVTFKYNDGYVSPVPKHDCIGFIAEEVDKLGLRGCVIYNEDDTVESVNYYMVVPVLVYGIQSLRKEIDELKARVDEILKRGSVQ